MESYTASSAAYFALQAAALFVSPRLMVTLLSAGPDINPPTELETYFARSLALALFTLAMLSTVLSGILPLSSLTGDDSDSAPYRHATTLTTTTYHIASLISCYVAYNNPSLPATRSFLNSASGNNGSVCFAAGMAISGSLASWGVLLLVFGDGSTSSSTKGRSRTSGWPFRNAERDEAKRAKKQH